MYVVVPQNHRLQSLSSSNYLTSHNSSLSSLAIDSPATATTAPKLSSEERQQVELLVERGYTVEQARSIVRSSSTSTSPNRVFSFNQQESVCTL